MNVTKTYKETLAALKKSAEIVEFLTLFEAALGDTGPLLLRNTVHLGHTASQGLMVLLRRLEQELAGDNRGPAKINGQLFPPTPEDREITARDLRAMVDLWFQGLEEEG